MLTFTPRLTSLQTFLLPCYHCRPHSVPSVRQQVVQGLGSGCSGFSLPPLVCHSCPGLWCWSPMGCSASGDIPALHNTAPSTPLTLLLSHSLCCFLLCSLLLSTASIFYPSLNMFSLRCHQLYWWAQLCHVMGPFRSWLKPGRPWPLLILQPLPLPKPCHLQPIQELSLFIISSIDVFSVAASIPESASFSFLGSSEESVTIERKPDHPHLVRYK